MVGLLGYAAAGALEGAGEGIEQDAKDDALAKRQMALLQLEQQNLMATAEYTADRADRRQQTSDQAITARQTAHDQAMGGMLGKAVPNADGKYVIFTKNGTTIPTNVPAPPSTDK